MRNTQPALFRGRHFGSEAIVLCCWYLRYPLSYRDLVGCKIHSVGSTDWFKNRESEIKRLLRRIEEMLEADPSYRKEQAKANQATNESAAAADRIA